MGIRDWVDQSLQDPKSHWRRRRQPCFHYEGGWGRLWHPPSRCHARSDQRFLLPQCLELHRWDAWEDLADVLLIGWWAKWVGCLRCLAYKKWNSNWCVSWRLYPVLLRRGWTNLCQHPKWRSLGTFAWKSMGKTSRILHENRKWLLNHSFPWSNWCSCFLLWIYSWWDWLWWGR